ncbi:heme lyase NrfEFG subunit NrfG [Salmonella enterica]|nr:heme lyase NrfEFG subunit NrfG [Salmonella enterica]
MSQSEHSTAPLRPMPVKRLAAAAVLMVAACVGGYLLTPKWQAVRSEQQRLADPLRDFTNPQTPEAQLSRLQEKIRANPQDSEQWARLGEYYLYRNAYDNALLAYRQALRLRGDNAQLFAALATVLYYKALALDATEVTAQMLLAADAFMQADYAQAVSLWQTLLDANSPRVNRAQLVEAINLAKLLQNRQK